MARHLCRATATFACALSAWIAAIPAAQASAFDVLGVGPIGIAEAGARAARVTDGTAAFFNPAGLGAGQGIHIELAPQAGFSGLSVQGRGVDLADPFGVVAVADATVPLKGLLEDRLRVGVALHIPPTALHLLIQSPSEPQYPYFLNRTQRLVVAPSAALKLASFLSIGAAVDVLGGVQGPADVRPGASGAPEPRISVDATTQAAAHIGVRVDIAERFHLAAVYRQEFAVPIAVQTKALIGGISLDADVQIHQALFDPHTFVLAAAVDVDRLEIEVDAAYAIWSAYKGPALDVRAELPGALLTSETSQNLFHDVPSVRAAGSYGLDVGRRSEIVLHAGTGFEPSILSGAPQSSTNFVDGPKVFGGLGASLALRDGVPRTLRFALGLGVTGVLPTTIEKRACTSVPCPAGTVAGPDASDPSKGITDPGYPKLTSGGALWAGSIGVGVDL
ncbi:MAG: hypothetical protein U0441_11465 [Polyangiaceae bacterium]